MPAEINNINLIVNFIKEGKQVVAYSPALDLSTVGDSEKEAGKNFEEIVQVFFKDILKRGVMTEVLTELGWKRNPQGAKVRSKWMPPEVRSANITVPVTV